MNSTTRSRTARRKSGKRAASFVLKRSKPLYKLEQSTKSRFMRLCGLDWLKEKFSCCKKAVLESPSGSLKDVRLPTAYMNTKLKQTFSGAYRTDSDKIKPKRVGDFRKTLVIELNDLLVYFQPKDHEPALIELIKDKTVSNVEPHPINLLDKPNNEVVEVEPIFRDDLPNFLKELNDFYEIILWTTMPKKVKNTVNSQGDGDNYESY